LVIAPEPVAPQPSSENSQPQISPPTKGRAVISTTSIPPSANPSMASTLSPSRNTLNGCLSKILIVLILSLVSGVMGWFAGRLWIDKVTQIQDNSLPVTTSDNSPANKDTGISDREWERKKKLQGRRLKLGLNNQFFYQLVDLVFADKYPSQAGKTLTNKPEDASWREKWDNLANDLLDKLSLLSREARQGLGQYNQAQREQWKIEVNQLHLSSRALYDLADTTFFYHFPEQENQEFIDKPIGQVWSAFVYDKLQALQSGKIYTEILLSPEALETKYKEKLEPGSGVAYVVQLDSSQFVSFNLDAPKNVQISIYSPTGRNNLLENYSTHQWSGNLPEDGYYEIVIVSQAKNTVDYQLHLKVGGNN
jgi:serine/threonine-protein kinase